ncbi:MAG: hypothetical protein WD355_00710 [Balneolaceae bacterium]
MSGPQGRKLLQILSVGAAEGYLEQARWRSAPSEAIPTERQRSDSERSAGWWIRRHYKK